MKKVPPGEAAHFFSARACPEKLFPYCGHVARKQRSFSTGNNS